MLKHKIPALLMCGLLLLTGCSGDPSAQTPSGTTSYTPLTPPPPAPSASEQRPTRPVTTTVTLADGNIAIEGEGASAEGSS